MCTYSIPFMTFSKNWKNNLPSPFPMFDLRFFALSSVSSFDLQENLNTVSKIDMHRVKYCCLNSWQSCITYVIWRVQLFHPSSSITCKKLRISGWLRPLSWMISNHCKIWLGRWKQACESSADHCNPSQDWLSTFAKAEEKCGNHGWQMHLEDNLLI